LANGRDRRREAKLLFSLVAEGLLLARPGLKGSGQPPAAYWESVDPRAAQDTHGH